MVTAIAPGQREAWAPAPSRRLRIAHVTATFPPYTGGTGTVAYHNALELAKRGHEVHVITPASGSLDPANGPTGLTVHRLSTRFRVGNAPFSPSLGGLLTTFDLVHLHYPFYFGAEQVWWARRRAGLPYVVTYHQDVILQGALSVVDRLHHRVCGHRILCDARFVGATSADYAASSRLAAVPARRRVEIPNGVDTERFHPAVFAESLRASYGLTAADGVILFVATLDRAHYFKGLDVLLAALQMLPSASLVVVGDGDRRQMYERLAGAAGVAARTRFLGYVPEAEMAAHFALTNVVAVPSTTRGEAFSLVAVEAMASGKPVVASRLPGVRSVVEDGATGLLVKPQDAGDLAAKLRTVLADRQLADSMGRAGRLKAEARYDWRSIGERLEDLYFAAIDQ